MNAWTISRGTTRIFEMQLQTPAGGVYTPPSGANIALYVAPSVAFISPASATLIRQLSLLTGEAGVVWWEFSPADTAALEPKSYWAEVRVERNGKVWKTDPFRFIVNNAVVNV